MFRARINKTDVKTQTENGKRNRRRQSYFTNVMFARHGRRERRLEPRAPALSPHGTNRPPQPPPRFRTPPQTTTTRPNTIVYFILLYFHSVSFSYLFSPRIYFAPDDAGARRPTTIGRNARKPQDK